MLKYKYICQKYTEAILSNSTRKLLWFEITKMLIAFKKITYSDIYYNFSARFLFRVDSQREPEVNTQWSGNPRCPRCHLLNADWVTRKSLSLLPTLLTPLGSGGSMKNAYAVVQRGGRQAARSACRRHGEMALYTCSDRGGGWEADAEAGRRCDGGVTGVIPPPPSSSSSSSSSLAAAATAAAAPPARADMTCCLTAEWTAWPSVLRLSCDQQTIGTSVVHTRRAGRIFYCSLLSVGGASWWRATNWTFSLN